MAIKMNDIAGLAEILIGKQRPDPQEIYKLNLRECTQDLKTCHNNKQYICLLILEYRIYSIFYYLSEFIIN